VEAKALARATEQLVVNFLFEEIFVRFGVPRQIVTDQGTQFTSKLYRIIQENIRSSIGSLLHIILKQMDK
jgi:hypothetical protein